MESRAWFQGLQEVWMAEARCICETRGLLHCGSPLCDRLSFLSAIWSEGASDISLQSCDGAKSKSCTIVLKEEVVKPVLKNLLKLYEKNWELIEEENYRVLADAIFDEAETQAAEENRPPQNAVYIVYMGTYSHGLRDDLNRVSKFEESHIGFLGSLLDRFIFIHKLNTGKEVAVHLLPGVLGISTV